MTLKISEFEKFFHVKKQQTLQTLEGEPSYQVTELYVQGFF
jgi:hypothetical protein